MSFLIIITPLVLGFACAYYTRKEVASPWYRALKKPWFCPPPYVFGPAWTFLYLALGISLNRVQNLSGSSSPYNGAIIIFWSQLVLNYMWTYLFFVKKDIILSVIDITAIGVLSFINMIWFFKIDFFAGLLLVPYFIWILYASAITVSIHRLNEDFKDPTKNRLVPATE